MLHLDLGKHDYLTLRSSLVEKNIPKMFPSYAQVQDAATRSMPSISDIEISETHAAVRLQALLDHTAKRLLLVHEPDLLESARYISFLFHDLVEEL